MSYNAYTKQISDQESESMVFNINLPATKIIITLLDVKILLCPQNDVYKWSQFRRNP
jgi:hypothetical protein